MPLSINTNFASLVSQRALERHTSALGVRFQRLSTGQRINSAKDDAAGLAVSLRLTSQIRGLSQAARNANDGVSLASTAEAALGQSTEILHRLRELSVQSGNGTLSLEDRQAIQAEVDQLTSELDRIGTETSFNGQPVLDGSLSTALQVGADAGETIPVEIADARSAALGVDSVDLTSQSGATQALDALDAALNQVSSQRAELGSIENRLDSTIDALGGAADSLTATRGRIMDADFATETAGLVRDQILQQSAQAILAQANLSAGVALNLLAPR